MKNFKHIKNILTFIPLPDILSHKEKIDVFVSTRSFYSCNIHNNIRCKVNNL